MNKYRKLLSDVGLFAISNFGSKILVFLMLPLYTSTLSTYEYGVADLMTGTINLLFPILTLAITEATLRFAFEKDNEKGQILGCSFLFIAASFILLLLCTFLIGRINTDFGSYWGYFLALYLSTAIDTCLSNYTRGVNKVRLFALNGILQTALLVSANVLFLVAFRLGLAGYLLAIILSNLFSIGFLISGGRFYLDLRFLSLNSNLMREMLRFSVPMIPTIIAWWIMQISDKYIIILYLGIAASGIYSISYKIPTILSTLTSIFIQAWQISAIKSVGNDDHENFVSTVYRYFSVFSVGVCAVLIVASKLLGTLLYAKDYFIAWTYVPILLVAYLFSSLSGVLASLFSAAKKTLALFYSTLVGSLLNLGLNFLLIPRFGVMAAAYTTLIGFLFTWVVRMISVQKILTLKTNGVRDLIAYGLLILEAVVTSLDLSIKYPLSSIIIFFLVIIYLPELKIIIFRLFQLLPKKKA